jgi:hypothetical protein
VASWGLLVSTTAAAPKFQRTRREEDLPVVARRPERRPAWSRLHSELRRGNGALRSGGIDDVPEAARIDEPSVRKPTYWLEEARQKGRRVIACPADAAIASGAKTSSECSRSVRMRVSLSRLASSPHRSRFVLKEATPFAA